MRWLLIKSSRMCEVAGRGGAVESRSASIRRAVSVITDAVIAGTSARWRSAPSRIGRGALAGFDGLLPSRVRRAAGGWSISGTSRTPTTPFVVKPASLSARSSTWPANSKPPPSSVRCRGKAEGEVSREQALIWLAEALEDLGAHAQQYGVPLLYEPLNRYETNLLNRQLDAAQFFEKLKTANVKLLCDLFHMNIEEISNAGTLRACGRHVGHVHFADSNRRAIGFGHTETASVIAALQAINFNGYLSGEILPLPDSEAAAAQTIKAIRQHLPR